MPKKTKLESQIGKPYEVKISEDQLQKQVASYINLKYPKILYCHVPNGGSRNLFEAVKLKAMGTRPGIPDILIFNRKSLYSGCFVELKVGKNKNSDKQTEVQNLLLNEGWAGGVAYTFEEARSIIDNYLLS